MTAMRKNKPSVLIPGDFRDHKNGGPPESQFFDSEEKNGFSPYST
jgi:hypothetical protein